MKILVQIHHQVDLDKLYRMVTPLDKKACSPVIRRFVKFLVQQRASSEEGWQYPYEEYIAGELVEKGLATINADYIPED